MDFLYDFLVTGVLNEQNILSSIFRTHSEVLFSRKQYQSVLQIHFTRSVIAAQVAAPTSSCAAGVSLATQTPSIMALHAQRPSDWSAPAAGSTAHISSEQTMISTYRSAAISAHLTLFASSR